LARVQRAPVLATCRNIATAIGRRVHMGQLQTLRRSIRVATLACVRRMVVFGTLTLTILLDYSSFTARNA
jgi:hypothetical protein